MFEKIIEWAGSRAELARLLDVKRSAVRQWEIDGIPPARAIQIEELSQGIFRAVDIVGGGE